MCLGINTNSPNPDRYINYCNHLHYLVIRRCFVAIGRGTSMNFFSNKQILPDLDGCCQFRKNGTIVVAILKDMIRFICKLMPAFLKAALLFLLCFCFLFYVILVCYFLFQRNTRVFFSVII